MGFDNQSEILPTYFYERTSANVFWYSINILRKMGYQHSGFLKYRDNLKNEGQNSEQK